MSTVFDDSEQVAQALAELTAEAVRRGARTLVLAGGRTPRRAYEILAEKEVAWGLVTVLFGDERCVAPQHPDSNYAMVRAALLDRAAPATVLRLPAELGAEAGASAYDAVVRALSPLDLVLLGIGPDGHTASLFPGHPALAAEGYAVAVHDAPKPPPDRVSLTLRALREARRVVVVATGGDKREAVARARRGEVPAGMIAGAELLVDRAAGG